MPTLSPKFVLEHNLFLSLMMRHTINWRVIVVFAYDQEDLDPALSIRDYLVGTWVIMVLSDWNAETVKRGLPLSPSLIVNANGDCSNVVAVLEKISTVALKPFAAIAGAGRPFCVRSRGGGKTEQRTV
jgi:hypothetical protein